MSVKKAFSFILVLVGLSWLFSVNALAEYSDDILQNFDFSPLYESLGDEKDLIGEVGDFSQSGVLGADKLLAYALSLLEKLFSSLCGELSAILCVIIAASAAKKFSAFSSGVASAVSFIGIAVLCKTAFDFICSDIAASAEFFTVIKAFFASAVPIMTGLYSMGGRLSAAAASGIASSVILSASQIVCESIALPGCYLCFAISYASAFFYSSKIGNIAKAISGICSKITALVMGLVASGTLFSVRLAASSDSAVLRISKFAASSFIPIVGGALSEAASAMKAGLSAVGSAFGFFGIAAVLYAVIPVTVRLLCRTSLLSFASFLAGAVDCNEIASLFDGILTGYRLMSAAVAGVSACFILACSIFVNTVCA